MGNTIQGDGFSVTIIKSTRRKTMALKVNRDGVSVHMPSNAAISLAKNFVQQKTSWIQYKLKQQNSRQLIIKHYVDGESLLFLGEQYNLRLNQSAVTNIHKDNTDIVITSRSATPSTASVKRNVVNWYKQQAELYIKERTQQLTTETGLKPRSITVKTYKARWGSCKITGDIQFNWKLLLAPPAIIDYVIVHELCHLVHHNHSAAFWQLVAYHFPDFKQARLWLKENGHQLEL
ncbi:hypothetical protein A9Q78_03235 [Methylophaga sp. 41_12_T18]|nr:hypothetical protein A9Q78_03235 [Methylophaga sp. 41_12_T18]